MRFVRFPLLLLLFAIHIGMMAQRSKVVVDTLTNLVDASVLPYRNVKPGDTILFQVGNRSFLLIRNFQGQQGQPILFMNEHGIVTINTDHYFGISFEGCQFIRLTGTGDESGFYGFVIQHVKNGAGLSLGKGSSDFEIDHIFINDIPIGGIYAKSDPDCDFQYTREKFTQYNTVIHDNYLSNIGNEGLYIGSTKFSGQTVNCNGKDTVMFPPLLKGVKIYNNIINFTGWDGIQVSSAAEDCQVHDNLVMYDSQAEIFGQMSGIILGGNSKCDCFNNSISHGKGIGIESHQVGGYRIFNNIIEDAGRSYLPSDPTQMKHGMFITDVSMNQDSSVSILFNNIINPKSDGIRFSSIKSRNNLIASNVIINPGNYDYYENGGTSFKGKDAYIMIPDTASKVLMVNNYLERSSDSAGFEPNRYTLTSGSPLVDAGYHENRNVTFDFYHHPRPYGNAFDIGAHEYNPAYQGLKENPTSAKIKIDLYPNPVTDSFSIRFTLRRPERIILDIYDLKGKRTDTIDLGTVGSGTQVRIVNVSRLPAGIYLYNMRLGDQVYSSRFIKAERK